MKFKVLSVATLLGLSCAVGGLLSIPAEASTSGTDTLIQMQRAPNEFYIFDSGDIKKLSYRAPRDFRVCAKTRSVDIPLQVTHDNLVSVVSPGECLDFNAADVAIRAGRQPDANTNLMGTISMVDNRNS